MIKKLSRIIFFAIFILNFNLLNSSSSFLNEGIILFEKKNYKKSKMFFEKDIVFNPKSEKSYLYLAKIFKEEKKDILQENNLDTVLLINPKNEEAIYLLALLSIKKSNFSKAKELIGIMNLVCEEFCSSSTELQKKLDSSLKK